MTASLDILICEILELPPQELTDEHGIHTVESWDSLRHLDLVQAIESAFALQLTGTEIIEMNSVGAIRAVLRRRGVAPDAT